MVTTDLTNQLYLIFYINWCKFGSDDDLLTGLVNQSSLIDNKCPLSISYHYRPPEIDFLPFITLLTYFYHNLKYSQNKNEKKNNKLKRDRIEM